MALKSMKRSASEKKAEEASYVGGHYEEPDYPYGLRIDLDSDMLKKLGIGPMPVGTEVMVMAKAKVISSSSYESEGDKPRESCGIQITDMDINVAGSDASSNAASKLYPDKD
jgi:hypothetical protein